MSAAGILADVGTMISPEDSGAVGEVDRGAAGLNALALGASSGVDLGLGAGWIAVDSAAAVIPGVGEVVIGVTGAYLAGDFIYHHRAQVVDAATDIGHAFVSADQAVARWEVQGVTDAESAVKEGLQAGLQKTGHVAGDIGHGARSAWHSISSTVGSWF